MKESEEKSGWKYSNRTVFNGSREIYIEYESGSIVYFKWRTKSSDWVSSEKSINLFKLHGNKIIGCELEALNSIIEIYESIS